MTMRDDLEAAVEIAIASECRRKGVIRDDEVIDFAHAIEGCPEQGKKTRS